VDRPANWDRIADLAKTLGLAPHETIHPTKRSGVLSVEGRAIADLAALADADSSVRLEVIGTLGEGGMGIVRLGKQVALDREVAIKELTAKRRGDERSVLKLLQEAWVAGSLEHPNIVPIYDIEVRSGEPRIVMKRIEGAPWNELINDPDAVAERFGESDLLEWNLHVLMQVANALRYAHYRRIVHLDLKPANVMLGKFGEVYLVDWGLGMSLGDGSDGRFPLASDTSEIIGTPAYLAPEMLTGDGSGLSERTDVYLLGSVLCEVLTGKPPHRGSSLMAILYQAATAGPDLPESVPQEIRDVCTRAMALRPEDRFESADAFRSAVREFVQHRGSVRLCEEAARQLVALRAVIDGPDCGSQAHWDEVHRTFTEARFGFRQALGSWPDNPIARDGLRRSVLAMGEHVLAYGSASTAATLLSELDEIPDDLRRRIDEGLHDEAGEAARIRKLELIGDDMDLNIGRSTRLLVLGILGILFVLYPLVASVWRVEPGLWDLFGGPALFLGVTAGLGWFARETLSKTLVNRRLYSVIVTMFVAQIVLSAVTLGQGIPVAAYAALLLFMWTLVATFATLLVELRLWPTALGQALALLAVSIEPSVTLAAIVLANSAFVVNIVVVWWPGSLRGTYDGDARLL
jgi:serine/threonine-protein kinase